ncbi:hypothetical protein X922_00765 [Pseudomonas aeruginosa VRFPA08]|nr:hypothetical protein X922_00765 [Pseudomonas aeruginosa VRFPA08]
MSPVIEVAEANSAIFTVCASTRTCSSAGGSAPQPTSRLAHRMAGSAIRDQRPLE